MRPAVRDERFEGAKLTTELVPRTAWFSNVRQYATKAQWEVCKRWANARAGGYCEGCGKPSRPGRLLDTHEVWDYEVTDLRSMRGVQRLVGLTAICPACHEVKHLGFAETRGRLDAACEHLARANGWDHEDTYEYVANVFSLWQYRSQMQWELDLTFLSMLGLEVDTTRKRGRKTKEEAIW